RRYARRALVTGRIDASSVATSIMTVVSIVFAILLMTLTLASTQFSPRILISFVRDRTTQWTLGVFLGTFSYCMAALPAARSLPHPFELGVNCSPLRKSTCTVGTRIPFSARKMRTRRGLGAVLQSYNFIARLLRCRAESRGP